MVLTTSPTVVAPTPSTHFATPKTQSSYNMSPPGFEEYEPLFNLPSKVAAVPNFEVTSEQAKLKAFLGLLEYKSKFCSTSSS